MQNKSLDILTWEILTNKDSLIDSIPIFSILSEIKFGNLRYKSSILGVFQQPSIVSAFKCANSCIELKLSYLKRFPVVPNILKFLNFPME